MKNIHFLFILFILYINGFCQPNISFPLEIGNKFFYKGGHDPDNGYYGSTKAIIDTFTNGTRVISATNYYADSTSNATEYWLFNDNKFYAESYYPFSLDFPVFNGDFTEDTCIVGGLSPKCYYIFYSTIFNQNRFCEKYSDIWFHMGTYVGNHTYTANNIGIYFKMIVGSSYGYSSKDSIELIGFINNGNLIGDSILTTIQEPDQIKYSFNLNQNYPNPFNPTTTIKYQVTKTVLVTLKVYDLLGREVATLVNEEKPAGEYEVEFDGNGLSSGIYFYKLQTENFSSVKKMILLK